MVAQKRLTEPRVTMERPLAKPRSFSNLPAFSDLNGIIIKPLNRKLKNVYL